MNQLWAMHDLDPASNGGCFRIAMEDAHGLNRQGFGIFHTVNTFQGDRKIQNLTRINAWAIDMDGKGRTKDEMWKTIEAGLLPTVVVETKSGFHVYWKAKDAMKEHWNLIVKDRLVPFYGSDPRARDLARILRTPGFMHMKNPQEPFEIKKLHDFKVAYTEDQMARFYPAIEDPNPVSLPDPKRTIFPSSGGFWERVWALDCEEALNRLSGHDAVGGETYQFKRNATGTKNIWANGKSTSTWIDANGRIGSLDGGGPTIYQWLNWYHRNPKKVVRILKEVFPELEKP